LLARLADAFRDRDRECTSKHFERARGYFCNTETEAGRSHVTYGHGLGSNKAKVSKTAFCDQIEFPRLNCAIRIPVC
jgi:hypothetical protein